MRRPGEFLSFDGAGDAWTTERTKVQRGDWQQLGAGDKESLAMLISLRGEIEICAHQRHCQGVRLRCGATCEPQFVFEHVRGKSNEWADAHSPLAMPRDCSQDPGAAQGVAACGDAPCWRNGSP